ncbi:helix-turn-helix domain-containing protein [Lebetimonas sp. JS032]|uniref:helix-turn-helix domain-containing protein n=1 Tax=Lebetimonas sp. JS032 TaxID=990070 RepID=UPI000463149B|nr:helix-turn-helix transcriptional regulator [Lebetimonas sp. JS032]
MKEVYKKIGENVKKIRESKNITQLQLAEMIGHKSTTIIAQGELGGKKHFNIEHLYKILIIVKMINILYHIPKRNI